MPTNAAQIVLEAKRLQRLQTKRRSLTKQLKDVQKEINLVRKHLKSLAADDRDPFDQLPPMKWEK